MNAQADSAIALVESAFVSFVLAADELFCMWR